MNGLTHRLIVGAVTALGLVCALLAADRANPPDMTRANTLSPEVTARDGTLLRAFLSKDGAWRIKTTPDQVNPRYLAMLRAFEGLPSRPAHALVDGNQPPNLPCPITCIISGDAISLSIAAASIIAKVERDKIMRELAETHPLYGWGTNVGYSTK